MTLTPIPAVYRGIRFRSRLEARWAVFFDSIGESFCYEREGYKLKSGYYLPDFWLPRFASWLEVKPFLPVPDRARKLCEELAWSTGQIAVLAVGLPGEHLEVYARPLWYESDEDSDDEFAAVMVAGAAEWIPAYWSDWRGEPRIVLKGDHDTIASMNEERSHSMGPYDTQIAGAIEPWGSWNGCSGVYHFDLAARFQFP